jgi:hypothetical protein
MEPAVFPLINRTQLTLRTVIQVARMQLVTIYRLLMKQIMQLFQTAQGLIQLRMLCKWDLNLHS